MAGLLGNGWDDPQSAAIMALAGGLLRGDFGGGLLGANQAFAEAKAGQMRGLLAQAQLDETRAQTAERTASTAAKKAEMERQARIREALPGLFNQGGFTGGEAAPQSMGGIPMFSQPMGVTPMQARPAGFDVQGALRLGLDPETIAKYHGLTNLGRPKVARTVEVDDGRGGKATVQLDDYGQPVGSGLPGYIAPVQVNQGDRSTFVRPQPGVSLPINMSPSERASNALGWANNAISRERLAFDKSAPRGQIIETQTGYMLADPREGTARPMLDASGQQLKGKAADRQLTDSQAKANLFGSRMQEADRILREMEGKYSPMAVNSKMAAAEMPVIGGTAGYIGNLMLTESGQQAEQAQRDFVNAVLRRESGAVISPQEFANAQKQYFPQQGDTPKTLEQKRRNRQIAIEGLMAEVPTDRRGVPSLANPGLVPQTGGATGGWGGTDNDPLGIRR